MTSKLTCCLFVTLAFTCNAVAQDNAQDEDDIYPAKHTIKVNVLQLASQYMTLPVAYEVRVAPHWSVQFEAGYVFGRDLLNYFTDKRGVKIRSGVRWYPAKMSYGDQHEYFTLEPYATIVNFEQGFPDDPKNTIRYREQGVALRWGRAFYIKGLVIDPSAGFRIRSIHHYDINLSIPQPDGANAIADASRVGLGFNFNLSIGWHSFH